MEMRVAIPALDQCRPGSSTANRLGPAHPRGLAGAVSINNYSVSLNLGNYVTSRICMGDLR